MTFLEFSNKYSTQEECLQAIIDARWPHGFICPDCGHNDGYRLHTRPVIECCVCGNQQSIMAGTLFERTTTPLRIWFSIIYEVAHDKGGASALRLSKRFGMRRSTIHNILHKVRIAMGTRDANLTLAGYIEMDEAFFGGKSKKVPGESATRNKKQVLVLVESEGKQAGNVVMKVIDSGSPEDLAPVIAEKVESEPGGQWFRSDGWGSLHVVINDGHLIEMTAIPKALLDSELRCASLAVSHAKAFFKGTYHHFCKKHIQRYLDEFCYRWNRRHLEPQIASHLITACVLHPAVHNLDLLARAA